MGLALYKRPGIFSVLVSFLQPANVVFDKQHTLKKTNRRRGPDSIKLLPSSLGFIVDNG